MSHVLLLFVSQRRGAGRQIKATTTWITLKNHASVKYGNATKYNETKYF